MLKLFSLNSYYNLWEAMKEGLYKQYTFVILFILFFLQTMLFIYIDDGKYSLSDYEYLGTWALTASVSFILTGIGSLTFLSLTKRTNLPWRARFSMSFAFASLIITSIVLFINMA